MRSHRPEAEMSRPATVDEYMSALPAESRRALERLRATIRAAAPEATEAISYQMPAFKDRGRGLVAYAAFRDHCSLFPMSMKVIEDHEEELRPYHAGKGTLHFRVDQPIPDALVHRLVRARLAENAAKRRR